MEKSQISKLFKLQLDNRFTLFKKRDWKLALKQIFKYIVFVAVVTLALYLVLNKVVFLLAIKINAQMIATVILFTQAITFFFALGNIIRTMYLSKDNELLMVLPVTFNQLFVSKTMVLYVAELIFSIKFVLPVFLALGFLGHLPILYFAMILLVIPILPLLPIAVACLLSIPTIFVVKFLKKHTILSVLTVLVLVATIFVLYMLLVGKVSGAFNIAEKQIETGFKVNRFVEHFGASLFGYYQIGQSMLNISLIYYPILYCVIALGIMCLCLLIIKPFYYKIATISTEQTSRVITKKRVFKKRTPFAELLLNEVRSVFRSPSYIFQFFLFPLFMPLIVFTYDKLILSIAVNQAGQNMIFGSHILILTIVALMSNIISSIAISKEGSVFYLAKTSPIQFRTQALAKLAFNAIFTVGAILVTTVVCLIATNLPVWVVLVSSLTAIILSLGHICHSFDMDLQNPVLDWYDNSEISTIGKSTTKSMIYALVFGFAMCLVVTLLGTLGIFVALGISVVYLISRMHLLDVRIDYYYDKMEI